LQTVADSLSAPPWEISQEATLKAVSFSGHIVMVVKTLESIQHMVSPLRKKHMKLVSPIVVMCSSTPGPQVRLVPLIYEFNSCSER
jgi:hypothetical protein